MLKLLCPHIGQHWKPKRRYQYVEFNTRKNYSDKAENHSIKLAIDKQLEETSGEKKAPGKDSKKL